MDVFVHILLLVCLSWYCSPSSTLCPVFHPHSGLSPLALTPVGCDTFCPCLFSQILANEKGGMIGVSQVGWVQPEARAWSRNKLSVMPVTAAQTHTVKCHKGYEMCCQLLLHAYIHMNTCSRRLAIFPCALKVLVFYPVFVGSQHKENTL